MIHVPIDVVRWERSSEGSHESPAELSGRRVARHGRGWNRFFFTPTDPATIGFIRICAGTMMFYTHLVWSLRLNDFFGSHAWVTQESARDAIGLQHRLAWSFWWLVDSPTAMWTIHAVVLVVMAMYALGLFTRVTTVSSVLAAISYVNRTPGALFGLDQLNIMLGLYLCLAPAGDAYSLDRWLQSKRLGKPLPPAEPSTSANLATRLIQLHMCVIYFFAGLSKLQGSTWWSGDALWLGFANYEYQSLDMTWTAAYPLAKRAPHDGDGLLGAAILCHRLAEADSAARVSGRDSVAHGDRGLPRHDHVRHGDALRRGIVHSGIRAQHLGPTEQGRGVQPRSFASKRSDHKSAIVSRSLTSDQCDSKRNSADQPPRLDQVSCTIASATLPRC